LLVSKYILHPAPLEVEEAVTTVPGTIAPGADENIGVAAIGVVV
jgi:hypothetical protein